MYQVGEIVVYGSKGVFRIDNIGIPDIEWLNADKPYYTLSPLYHEEKVFTPVDTPVFMRPIMTKNEAVDFILHIPNIQADEFECKNPHVLQAYYQNALESHDSLALVKIIKKTHEKKLNAEKNGKKLAQVDERYMKKAENILHEELAAALEIKKENVVDYIAQCLNKA